MREPNPNVQPEQAQAIWDAARPSAGSGPSERVVTAHCTLITPMFGGGVTAGEVDPEMPIRASALRGQLRFWWRLLYGAGKKPADLFAAESALWGGISSKGPRASRVTLQVRQATKRAPGDRSTSSAGTPVSDQQLIRRKDRDLDHPEYALILEPKDNPELLKAGYTFELVLRFRQATTCQQQEEVLEGHASGAIRASRSEATTCQQQEEVLEALRWWASFSGVGARTRRGLGAVKVTRDDVELTPVTDQEVEDRGGWMVTGQPASNAIEAWKKAVGALQRFRQGAGVGRNPGHGNRPGRSRWPEPDTIRCATETHAEMHKPEHQAKGFYPRAAFGLPIVFHFKDKGDPRDQVLNPGDDSRDRMASPLILRPWFDGQRYRPVALLLPRWKERLSVPVRLELPGAATSASASPEPSRAWPKDPDERKRLAAQIQPMRDQDAADPLSAFMHFFQARLAGGGR